MTTVSSPDHEIVSPDPDVTPSLTQAALLAAPERSGSRWPVCDPEERAMAAGQLAITIRETAHLLSLQDRREFAAELLRGVPACDTHSLVLEFHCIFGLPINNRSRTVDELRARLILEEAQEAADAILSGNQEHVAKELADLLYVTHGTAITHGIDLPGAVVEVHQSNLSKLVDGQPLMRPDGKVLKGPNYHEPDMGAYVRVRS